MWPEIHHERTHLGIQRSETKVGVDPTLGFAREHEAAPTDTPGGVSENGSWRIESQKTERAGG